MFCASCGTPVEDGQAFCAKCGASLGGAAMPYASTAQDALRETAMPPTAEFASGRISNPAPKRSLPHMGKTAIVTAIVAVCAVVAVAVGILVTANPMGGVAEADDMGVFVFEVEARDAKGAPIPADDVAVPIEVEGMTTSGQHVYTRFVYRPETGPYALPAGGYQVRVLSAPVGANGTIYGYPNEPYHVEVLQGSTPQNPSKPADPIVIEKLPDATSEELKQAQEEINEAERVSKDDSVVKPAESDNQNNPNLMGEQPNLGNADGPGGSANQQGDQAGGPATGGNQQGGQPGGTATGGNQQGGNGGNPAADGNDKPGGDSASPKKTDGDLRAEEIAAAKEAAEERMKQEKEAALAGNKRTYESTNDGSEGPRAQITGVVCKHETHDRIADKDVTVYTLRVPEKVSVVGTQYGEVEDDEVIVSGDVVGDYVDEVVTLEGSFSVRSTASIPEAEFSALYCNSARVVNDYHVNGFVVSSDRMGGDYLVVTDYFMFEVPEYWRGKVKFDLAPDTGEYPYIPEDAVVGMRIICTAKGVSENDGNRMYYVSVIPKEDFEAGTYTGMDMINASCEATTDSYAVVFAMEDYFLHYDSNPDAYVQTITGGAMKGTSSVKGSEPTDMLRAANEFLRDDAVAGLTVMNAKGKLVAPKTVFPILESMAATKGA